MKSSQVLGSSTISTALQCPLCGRSIAPEVRPWLKHIDERVASRLQQAHPAWKAESGACPACVATAVDLERQANHRSIHEQLLLPYPVYSPDKAGLIPTPQRVGANPHLTGQGITLAFLDSGFYPHPDLTHPADRILCCVDASGAASGDPSAPPVEHADFTRPQVSSWHGLMTSCLAAGSGTMSAGLYRGVASGANLVLVKTGHPGEGGIREADITRALAWVIANQARFDIRVVNISLGGDRPAGARLSELDRLVEQAVARGMLVVAAAGNDGARRLVPPASAPAALTVGGLDDRNSFDRRLWGLYHSNYGADSLGEPKPEVVAPAMWLAAPMLPHTRVHDQGMLLWQIDRAVEQMLPAPGVAGTAAHPPSQALVAHLAAMRRQVRLRMIDQKYIHPHYQHVDGTSMAAAVASSVAAQVLQANPALTPRQVRALLMQTAQALPGFPAEQQGAGAIHAGRAVAAAWRAPGGPLHGLPLTPHVAATRVTFYYYDPSHPAGRVALVGAFNRWNPQGYRMQPLSPGLWRISIPRPPAGRYGYKFLLEQGWVEDFENPSRVEDGFGGFTSLLELE